MSLASWADLSAARRQLAAGAVTLGITVAVVLPTTAAAAGPFGGGHDRADGKVITKNAQSVHAGPTTKAKRVGSRHGGGRVSLKCKLRGETVDGNDIWYLLADREGWMAARYVKNHHPVPWCPVQPPVKGEKGDKGDKGDRGRRATVESPV